MLIPADLLIRDSLFRLGLNHDLVVIGIGKETFRDSNKHVSGGDQYQNAECQRQRTVPQHPLQGVIVNIQHPVEDPLGRSQQPSLIASMRGGLQESAAKHWSQRQRNHSGNENCRCDRDGEFTEQTSKNPPHEQNRYEYRGQRQGHRYNRERDLPGTSHGRLDRCFSHFVMPDDVLQHDDGVIDNKTNRKNQRHQ